MIHTEFKQGTPEWFEYRKGKITASHICDIMPKTRGTGYRAERENYMARLACEILTGVSEDSYTNKAMEHGTETEPFARSAYEAKTGKMVQQVGFIDHPHIKDSGCSPDGIHVGGGIEIKCPNTATHIQTLKTGIIKPEYILQMQWSMMCYDVNWWDFISFDDRLPENSQLYIKTVTRDITLCNQIEEEVKKFKIELDQMVKYLTEYKGETSER